MSTALEFHVNGTRQNLRVDARRTLLSILRDDLDLTGTKYGCGEGQCGACTVLLDGKPVKSCSTKIEACQGKKITTIEGLSDKDKLHPLQQAFLDAGAMQCGYCTTGMIMAGAALLDRKPDAGRDDIIEAMDGNICRCGTYTRIILAVRKAGEALKGGKK
jgi:aerobic-type carbon monoxide dehydrogenase small subunit (CoxS/CutS family)